MAKACQPGVNVTTQNIGTLANGTYTLQLIDNKTGNTITKKII